MSKKVLLIREGKIEESLVSQETDLNFLMKDHKSDDVILDWIDLPDGLTLVYNCGDSYKFTMFENQLAKKLFGVAVNNTVAICRYNNPETLDDLVDLSDEDLTDIQWRLQ